MDGLAKFSRVRFMPACILTCSTSCRTGPQRETVLREIIQEIVEYDILSHRWDEIAGEPTYQDISARKQQVSEFKKLAEDTKNILPRDELQTRRVNEAGQYFVVDIYFEHISDNAGRLFVVIIPKDTIEGCHASPDQVPVGGWMSHRARILIASRQVGWRGGVEGRDIAMGAWRGMRDSVMKAGGLGRFMLAEEFDKAMDEVAEEWDYIEGSHTALRLVYGRKPL
ncbi:hypothetical protein J3R83DRAFT_5195 [Lanmaoa asiatica]|nr:hypothetical protein J3R83DRAFT_5195 [Lanmaoa asiatica]